uniref:hypothetical protein n=1 Tax=Stappia sp. TaxID=1870903 RepID=UPI003BA97C54
MSFVKSLLAGLAGLVLFAATPVLACETYKALSATELKEFRDKLAEQDADPIDRLFAYQELACSDQPVMRAYAIRAGMENARDPILRQQIAFDALMALPRVDIELSGENLGKNAKRYVGNEGNVVSNTVRYRDPVKGCLSFNSSDSCSEGSAMTLKGDTLLVSVSNLVGTLALSETGEFLGTVRYRGDPITARVRIY